MILVSSMSGMKKMIKLCCQLFDMQILKFRYKIFYITKTGILVMPQLYHELNSKIFKFSYLQKAPYNKLKSTLQHVLVICTSN